MSHHVACVTIPYLPSSMTLFGGGRGSDDWDGVPWKTWRLPAAQTWNNTNSAGMASLHAIVLIVGATGSAEAQVHGSDKVVGLMYFLTLQFLGCPKVDVDVGPAGYFGSI
jgi:hypothetical protein